MATDETQIDVNLDTLEREKTYKPFAIAVGDRRIVMSDPANLDWKTLLKINDPTGFMTHCVPAEDREYLMEQEIPGWKLAKLLELYQKHYGLPSQGNADGSRT